jgi:SPP1 gp7 family putative phage head morphogenesis protein
MIPKDSFFTNAGAQAIQQIDLQLQQAFIRPAQDTVLEFMKLRRWAYALAAAGEVEGIARATGDFKQVNLNTVLDDVALSKTSQDQDLYQRIQLAYSDIRRKIVAAVERSRVMEEPFQDMLNRVIAAFPKAYAYKKPPKVLKTLQEAAKGPTVKSVSARIVDDKEWDAMVKDFLDGPDIPKFRFFNDEQIIYSDDDVAMKGYAWQIEQELTNDFVAKVRDGQEKSARDNGVRDFIWQAILDEKTDECCEWRDGLTTVEIQSELDGKHADDPCRALVPPAHFNCRCTLAPVGDAPDSVDLDFGEFSEWLGK